MVEKMKTWLKILFIRNWPRKCLSVLLAMIIWVMVHQSLTSTKTINNVPIYISNIPLGKTVNGSENGLLNRRINVTITGKTRVIKRLTANDLYVLFDASGKKGEWIATLTKRNIFSKSANFHLSQFIDMVMEQNVIIKMTKLVTERIPVTITPPIGQAPLGYEYIGTWPAKLYLTVRGPQEVVSDLKMHGLNLTFNLNNISKEELDELRIQHYSSQEDVVTFFIPPEWKHLVLPKALTSHSLEIDDVHAKYLHMDFLCYELLALPCNLPITLYSPFRLLPHIPISQIVLSPSRLVSYQHGMPFLSQSIYVKGVSPLFLEIVKEMIQLTVIILGEEISDLRWSLQFIDKDRLEDRYVAMLLSAPCHKEAGPQYQQLYEQYLRNRFRNYMNRLQLFISQQKKLVLSLQLKKNELIMESD